MKTALAFLKSTGFPAFRCRQLWLCGLLSIFLGSPSRGANTFTSTGSLANARSSHTATLLHSGKVLVAGGTSGGVRLATSELHDPVTGTWAPTSGVLATARSGHTATLLPNGRVLVVGGFNGATLASAELYDPATGVWSTTGALAPARAGHTATLLPNGKLLAASPELPAGMGRRIRQRTTRSFN